MNNDNNTKFVCFVGIETERKNNIDDGVTTTIDTVRENEKNMNVELYCSCAISNHLDNLLM